MSRGGFRGRGSFSASRGRGGRGGNTSYGPPAELTELGQFLHACEDQLVCKSTIDTIPYFNAPIFLENKQQVGQIDEILGPIHEVFFSVSCKDGVKAATFKVKDKLFIPSDKLLPLSRFLSNAPTRGGRGGSRGGRGGRGGFGGSRGGRGSFGGSRGGRGGFSAPRGRRF